MRSRTSQPSRVAATLLTCVLFLLVSTTIAAVDGLPIFELSDPRGDDKGDGTLRYPLLDWYEQGSLDLREFSARSADGGTWFEARFSRPIPEPWKRVIDPLGNTLDEVARHGFYTMNIDVYIDTDRIPGSGNTSLLPGRLATVSEQHSWEKAVCLTPRPRLARTELERILTRYAKREIREEQGRVVSEEVDALRDEIEADLSRMTFFPTNVRVKGRSISFFVPSRFLDGPARPDWAYLVVVTVPDLKLDTTPKSLKELGFAREDSLMILPVRPGLSGFHVGGGREDDHLQPPILDVLLPRGVSQQEVLQDYDLRIDRPVRLPAVIPAERPKP